MLAILFVALGLSMDAFSLSLSYGTVGLNKKEQFILSLAVGIFHFFMPFLGMLIGNIILNYVPLPINIIVFIILLILGVQMIVNTFKEEEVNYLNLIGIILFSISVSLDSFSVGIGLLNLSKYPLLSASIISVCSFMFTRLGLYIGFNVYQKLGNFATIIGGILLILLGFYYIYI